MGNGTTARYSLAIDQGTTSTRAILFDKALAPVAVSQQEFPQYFPHSGWVEHDPEDIWRTVLETCRAVMAQVGATAADIAGIGLTNQRETTLLWDRETGKPLHNAIVWQDRRTAALCARLKREGLEPKITETTGLLADPYFSGTKLGWLLETVDGASEAAAAGRLAFGTVDTFLIWRLTGGKRHVTDVTNAARTMLFDIHQARWDSDLLALFGAPESLMPEPLECAAEFGETDPALFGGPIAIRGVAGDQQAATIGQACFEPGMVKSTYGTGCFALINTGDTPILSQNRLLTTIAYQLDGKRAYALEGSIFVAGAAVQWLRDGLGVIETAAETQALAEQADPEQAVTLVPAFTGLGAPYWDAESRGAIFGLTRKSGPAEFARAALESVGFQTRDLLDAMKLDWASGGAPYSSGETVLRVDGGMTASDWTMQFLADILQAPVDRPKVQETTALGVAWLAGRQAGLYPDAEGFSRTWALDRRFAPAMPETEADERYARWKDAVSRTLSGRE